MKRLLHWIGLLGVIVVAVICAAWAFGAVWFDAPFGNANKVLTGLTAMAFAIALVFIRPFWQKLGVFAVLFGGVLIWWLTLSLLSRRAHDDKRHIGK